MLQLETHFVCNMRYMYVLLSYFFIVCYECRLNLHWVSYAIKLDKLVIVSVCLVLCSYTYLRTGIAKLSTLRDKLETSWLALRDLAR